MDLNKLSALGATERADALNKTENKYTKVFYSDSALGNAIKKDTVSFSSAAKPDNSTKRNDLMQKLGGYLEQILKSKETEIAQSNEPQPALKTADASYQAYVTDIEETNANLPPGKKKKVPISKEDYAKLHSNSQELNDFATKELAHYNQKYFSELAGDFESVGIKKFSTRPKGVESIQAKLVKKFSDNKIQNPESFKECIGALGDLEGGRLTIKNLSPEFSKGVLDLYGVKEEDYASYMLGDSSTIGNLDEQNSAIAANNISNDLKVLHTQNIVDRLTDLIRTGRVEFDDEFNNYGNVNTSYFTNGQIQQLADAHFQKTGRHLDVVSSINFDNENTTELLFDKDNNPTGVLNVKKKNEKDGKVVYSINNNNNQEVAEIKKDKAIKKSGYSSSQFNMLCTGFDGTNYGSEIQVRGETVNVYAEGEHVIYDILSGKTKTSDEKHGEECRLINGLDDNSKSELYNCLQYVYTHGRLEELGISPEPLNFNKFNFTGTDGTDKSEDIRNMLKDMLNKAKENDIEDTLRFQAKHPSAIGKK